MIYVEEDIPDRILQERRRIRLERICLVKDALLLSVMAIALTAFLLVWKAEITGMVVADPKDSYCESFGELDYVTAGTIALSDGPGDYYQLRLVCMSDVTTFHEDSEFIGISEAGQVRVLEGQGVPDSFEAFIIAEDGSGQFIGKKFRFEVR